MARKELRSETEILKKTSARHRSEIARLKRRINTLERQFAHASRSAGHVNGSEPGDDENGSSRIRVRYSAKSLASQRKRLGLSAAEFGKLVGVSAQTVYSWEAQKSRPREKQLAAFAAIRRLGKRDAATMLAQD